MTTIDPNSAQAALFEKLGITKQAGTQKASKDTLGQSDFLKLMTTQLQNQDPFAPMDNGDFIAILMKKISYTSETKSEQKEDSRISSLIKRIDILKTISELPDKIKTQTRANYNVRISNLRKLILVILKEIK